MSDIRRIGPSSAAATPAQVSKRQQQDSPQAGVVYAHVERSEGPAEETIQAILYFAKAHINDKRGGGQQKKKKKPAKPKYDPNKTYSIASDVPESMVQPRQNGCAPTCLAMLLRKYGLASSVREAYGQIERLRTAESTYVNDVGLSLEEIARYAQQAGLKARVQRGYQFLFQLEGLLRSLNRGTTPLASIQLPGMGNMRHAVLIVGVSQHAVTLVDPARPERYEMSMVDFQLAWQKEDSAQTGVGLAYVEIWGENARGQVAQTALSWDAVLEEMVRDGLMISHASQAKSHHDPQLIHFFED